MPSLRERRLELTAKAQQFQARIKAGDTLSASDVAEVKSTLAEIEDVDQKLIKADQAAETLAKIGALPAGAESATGNGPVIPGTQFIKSRALGPAILAKMTSSGFGLKGLEVSGSELTSIPLISTDPLVLPQAPASFLDVLPVALRPAPVFEYLRQTARSINAAFVPAGQQKPTSTLAVERVRGELQVLATLSEPLDKYLLGDNVSLANFVNAQLSDGIRHALEREVLSGDGTTYTSGSSTYQHLTGLLNTSGAQVLAATSADRAITLRQAVDLLEDEGHAASVFVLNPEDWRAVETQRNTSGAFDLGGIAVRSTRTLWGVPVVTTAELDAGTALALDTTALTLDTDGAVTVEWDSAGDLFTRNQLRSRVEGRFGLSIYRPAGIVNVTLTVGEGE